MSDNELFYYSGTAKGFGYGPPVVVKLLSEQTMQIDHTVGTWKQVEVIDANRSPNERFSVGTVFWTKAHHLLSKEKGDENIAAAAEEKRIAEIARNQALDSWFVELKKVADALKKIHKSTHKLELRGYQVVAARKAGFRVNPESSNATIKLPIKVYVGGKIL